MRTLPSEPVTVRLRVFVSSPGDVGEERERTRRVLGSLGLTDVEIEPVLWDDPDAPTPMLAGQAPQDSVNEFKAPPSQCDLTIMVLSSRLGSASVLRDGTSIKSGTRWEFDDAMRAGKPVLVYRRRQDLTIRPDESPEAAAERFAQYDAVGKFFREQFQGSDGEVTGGFTQYADADEFESHLGKVLRHLVPRLAERLRRPYVVPEGGPLRGGRTDIERLIGRDDEMRRLRELLLTGRHACIVQTPGVGKTALALDLVVRDANFALDAFAGVLWAWLGRLPQDLQPQLQEWARALRIDSEVQATLTSLDDWRDSIAQRIGTRRMLIVLDDVRTTQQAAEFMAMAPRSVFVITTRRLDVAGELDRIEPDQVIVLSDLAHEDALALLRRHAGRVIDVMQDRAEALIRRYGALPLAVVLMGKYLHPQSVKPNTALAARAFNALEQAEQLLTYEYKGDSLQTIINVSWKALDNDGLRQTLADLSIFRPKPNGFTDRMAGEILGLADPLSALEPLSNLGLIDQRLEDFTMHAIVHEFAQRHLDAQRQAELQRAVLRWYGREVNRLMQEGGDDLYASWYRYERADWQAAKDSWLHYLAVSGDVRGSMLSFLRVWFDAFWWWGFFEPFAFCRRLLDDWRQRSLGPEQREGLELLSRFAASFPPGIGRRGSRADWHAAEQALGALRQRLTLAADLKDNPDLLQVYGVMDWALAECTAWGHGDFESALAQVESAHDGFAAHGEQWTAGYLSAYAARYALEARQPERSRGFVLRGLQEAGKQNDDPELLSTLYGMLGDIDFSGGRRPEALASYRRAACYSFVYQALPKAADSYTVRYFNHVADELCERLLKLARTDPQEAVDWADNLRALWEPWWKTQPQDPHLNPKHAIADNDPGQLRRALFPVLPAAESREELVEFAGKVRRLTESLYECAGIESLREADDG